MRSASLWAAAVLILHPATAPAITAGPDDFGYTLADEAEPGVTYAWVDIPGEPTAVRLTLVDDDQSAPLRLGFDFMFYGRVYDRIHVLSNGLLRFSYDSSITHFHGAQCPLPQRSTVDGFIGFYHRDWHPSEPAWCGSGCTVHWATGTDTAGRNWFGVQFTNVPVCCSHWAPPPDPDPMTVQCLIYDDNTILVQVQDAGISTGEDATIGLEETDAMTGIVYPGCTTAGSTRDSMAVVFTPPAGGTPIMPRRSTGWGPAGGSWTHSFVVFNTEDTGVVFDVSTSGHAWTTAPDVTSLDVDAHDLAPFTVRVDIPPGAAGGSSDTSTITLRPTMGGAGDVTAEVVTLAQDEPDGWQRFSHMPILVERPATSVLGNDIYLVSGYWYDALAAMLYISETIQVLHTDTSTWDHSDTPSGGTLTYPPFTAGDAAACGMNGRVYVSGGRTGWSGGTVSNEVHVYDPTTDTWTDLSPMPGPRFEHAMVCDAARNTFYVIGGYGPFDPEGHTRPRDDIWAYEASTGTWDMSLEPLPGTRARHRAEMIDADTILVAGGAFRSTYSTRTDLYHIDTDTWERSGDLVWARAYAASGVLPVGRMCLSGGTSFEDLPSTLLEDKFTCWSDGFWIPQIARMIEMRTYRAGATVGSHIYAIGGADTDTLGWPPTTYDQTTLVERYPTGPLSDSYTDPVVDTPTDVLHDTPPDVPPDPPFDLPPDRSWDTPADTSDASDTSGPSGTVTETHGCGCSIAR